MRVAVIGAGAMGSLASLLLHTSGVEVVVYEQREERVIWLRENGTRVRGAVNGEVLPQIGLPGEVTAPYDVIVLAVGAGEGGEALRLLSPCVHRDTVYLSLQEGSAVSELAGMVGDERAYGAMAWVSAVETPGGEVEVEEFRSLVLGGFPPGGEARIAGLAEALRAASPGGFQITSDLKREVWKRLTAVAAVSGLCAVSGSVPEEARRSEEIDRLCGEASRECNRVAAAIGVKVAVSSSPWEEAVWSRIKPPLLRDVESAKRTEVAYLSGSIVAQARLTGVRVPVHSAISSLVRELESGMRRPGEASVKELVRRITEEKGMSLL